MSKPFISVVIPVFNGEKFIIECLNSLRNQTYSKFEIVVIDDGSSDNSVPVIQEKGEELNIKIIRQNNRGIPSAIKRGIQNAQSNFIVLMDQDDIATPNRIEETAKAFLNGAEIIMSAYEIVDENSSETGKKIDIPSEILNKDILLESLKRNYFLGSAMAFHNKHDFEFNPLSGGTTDYDIALKMLFNGYKFCYVPSVLLKYRSHELNTSANYKTIKKNALDVLNQYDEKYLFHKLCLKGYHEYDIYLTLGILCLFKEKTDLAGHYLECAEKIMPPVRKKDLELFFYKAVYYYNVKEYEKSLHYLKRSIVNSEKLNPSVANNIGVLNYLLNKSDEVEEWFVRARNLNCDYLDAAENLGLFRKREASQRFIFTQRLLRSTLLHSKNITGRNDI